jgi:diadenosine tetraphosphatase ApaH/serine/threonine PP2A family protein phosphatase
VRILVLSDIHSNLEGLEACIAAAPPHEVVVNLGDIVGYCASPNEVIEISRGLGKVFVRGNHDKAACGLIELHDFNPVAALAAEWTRQQLTPENLAWLRALPHGPVTADGVPDVYFVHGSPTDEDEYLISTSDALQPIMESPVELTFFGHTHLQGSFMANATHLEAFRPSYRTVGQNEKIEVPLRKGSRFLVNPGSVGQPRDGDWRAGFAVFDTESRIVTFCRVPYDLKSAQDRIFAAQLPTRLATRLAAGR